MRKSLMNYIYKAIIISVYDGDTVRADIDLGFGIWKRNESLRLARINAPEIRGESRSLGLESRDYLRSLILNKEVQIQTFKDKKGKYGRYIVEILLAKENINNLMVASQKAIYQSY